MMNNMVTKKKKVIVIPATKKKVTEEKKYYTELICQNKQWRLVKIFADEGRSGTNTKRRQEFNEMIKLCKQGKINIILSKSISRFARNIRDCILTIRELKEKGIAVIFEKEHINTLDISSEMMIALHSTFAQAESETISENVKWGKRRCFENGKITYHYKYWFGYKKGEDGQPEIIPEEAVFVREIYDKYLNGWSLDGIRDDLNESKPAVEKNGQGYQYKES